jgi:hypothetical protein
MTKKGLFEMNVSVDAIYFAPRNFIFNAAVTRDKSAHYCRYSCTSINIK